MLDFPNAGFGLDEQVKQELQWRVEVLSVSEL